MPETRVARRRRVVIWFSVASAILALAAALGQPSRSTGYLVLMTSSAVACAMLMVYATIRWKPQPFGPLLAVTASQITWITADILGALYGKTILPVQFMYFAGYFPCSWPL